LAEKRRKSGRIKKEKDWSDQGLKNLELSKDARISDPYVDRRSGEDRREIYHSDYFENDGAERRSRIDRRQPGERRKGFLRVSEWSSVCPDDTA
jgi:hypothetical protein